jgi:tetratricopeptide (TPR) repeat protein
MDSDSDQENDGGGDDGDSRLAEIQKIVAMAPNDPFPRYGLAMEYKNLGLSAEARRCFAEIMEQFPDYVPQYLMHGQLLSGLGDRSEAKRVLTQGVAKAQLARNFHAHGELQSALAQVDEGSGGDDD